MKLSKPVTIICAIGLFFLFTGMASAQYDDVGDLKKIGAGLQSSFPTFGISGIYNLNEQMAAQAVLGFIGSTSAFGGRFLYRFRREENYNFYGYGMLGIFRHKTWGLHDKYILKWETETVAGFGLGGGVEYFFEGLPEIGWNAELGIGIVDFEYYDFSAFMFGLGAHYYF